MTLGTVGHTMVSGFPFVEHTKHWQVNKQDLTYDFGFGLRGACIE